MARPRSDKVIALKSKLLARITDGFHRSGERFLSTRAVAERFGVCYQTAHRVIGELQQEGYLRCKEASGTYIAGPMKQLQGVELWFHPRARRKGSFGSHLLDLLCGALEQKGFAHQVLLEDGEREPSADRYPVIWELPALVERMQSARRNALLLNDRPPPGIGARLIDAVATDDFSAGLCAAETLARNGSGPGWYVVIAGPPGDVRSQRRVEGFRSHLPRTRVVVAGGWYFEDAARVADEVMALRPEGVFAVNDRLAEALIANCRERGIEIPRVVGHDNAPVAEDLHLTTVETPWDEMVEMAVGLIQTRLQGDAGSARHVLIAQRVIQRLTA